MEERCRIFLTAQIGGGEAYDDDQVIGEKVQKDSYWMASGMIHGITRGIHLFCSFLKSLLTCYQDHLSFGSQSEVP